MTLQRIHSRAGRSTYVHPQERAHPKAASEARHLEEIANEQAARRRGAFIEMDQGLSTQSKLRVAVLEAGRAMFHRRGGRGFEMYRGHMRMAPYTVLAKREPAFRRARELGIQIPVISDRHRGQASACWYEVLAVGEGVRDVQVGDEVLASCWIGDDMGRLLGTDIFVLLADGYECPIELAWDDSIAHGTLDGMAMGCRCGGDLLAVRRT